MKISIFKVPFIYCAAGLLAGILIFSILSFRSFGKIHQQEKASNESIRTGDLSESPILQKEDSYSWQRSDTSIALLKDKKVVWGFNFNRSYDKPYFYPLRIAGKEHDLVWLSPSDHPWHRGLWFSWKLINDVNYWEEDVETRLSEGRSKIIDVEIKQHEDYSATINMKLSYGPEGKEAVLQEERTLFISSPVISSPDEKGNYYIDWDLKFKVGSKAVILDRTPPESMGGPYYGGYGGISYRAAEGITDHLFRDSSGWQDSSELIGHGKRAQWMDMSGIIDSTANVWGGVTTFSHPANFNSPTPWYVYKDKDFAFYNAALLFDQAKKVEANERFRLLYRVLVHEGVAKNDYLTKEHQEFVKK